MPYQRPTLSQIRANVVAAVNGTLPGADALLRFSNIGVLGTVQAGLTHQHYGYLDWIALQTNPFTATGEYLEAWGALKSIYRKAAVQAQGLVTFPCAASTSTIVSGTALLRSDGTPYTVLSAAAPTSAPGGSTQPYQINVTVIANPDPTGLTGAFGDSAYGTQFTLGQTITGITSTGISGPITGGADLEDDADFSVRVIQVYQNSPQGGAASDYVTWALEVPGVTRAWCDPLYAGAGTVGVYFMMDETESAHGGLPQGSNGVAAAETRASPATGDQLTVANFIYPLRPVTALVYSLAPTLSPINISITGVATGNEAAVQAALESVINGLAAPGGTIELDSLWTAVTIADPGDDILITSPTADVNASAGHLPTLGTISW